MRPAQLLVIVLAAPPAIAQTAGPPEASARVLARAPFEHPALRESSGVAAGRSGVLWTHNDSGNEALLFATDSSGADLGTVLVTGAENIDWEDLAAAPCARAGDGRCLYLADTGDNGARRPWVAVYRVPEPAAPGPGRRGATAPADVLRLRWPGGARDVEAMLVAADERLYFVSKPRRSLPRLYRISAPPWGASAPVEPEDLGPVPIDPRERLGRLVTGAALSPDGTRAVVRTYSDLFFFPVDAEGRLQLPPTTVCDILGLEPQGEGVGWLDHARLVLGSERRGMAPGGLTVVTCERP